MPLSIPVPIALGRFKALPQRSTEVWQGGFQKLPAWIENPDDPEGEPYRPVGAFWVSLRTGLINMGLPEENQEASADLALKTFLDFGLKWAKQLEGRPARVEVSDPFLRDTLSEALAGLNTPVDLVDHLPQLKGALRDFEADSNEGRRPPGALEVAGVTPERLRAYADAAALFYKARPWKFLANEDLIVVEAPQAPRGMAHLCVLGAGGEQFGLSFFDSRREFEAVLDPMASWHPTRAHSLTFCSIDEMPFADVDAWEEHGLPVAGMDAYPLAADMRADGTMLRPDAPALNHLEALLRALADTTEEEMDIGRWRRQIDTFDGPVTLTLSLPLLLETEAGVPRNARRTSIVPTIAERANAQIGRILESRSFSSVDDMNAALEQARKQGLFDAAPEIAAGRDLTPLEKAQELAYDAMEASGRVRIKLARQALALSPDCADAWVLLAESAADPDTAVAHYQRGVDAGARAIGPENFAAFTGKFWGHLETRPYMRARLALAQTLWDLGRDDEALDHYREMLRLNPTDNQGVRELLLPALLERGKDEETSALLKDYEGDIGAILLWGRVLWLFRTEGDSAQARAAIKEANRINSHVAKYLCKPESMPLDAPPTYALGSPEEAAYAAEELIEAWEAAPDALAWLRKHALSGHSAFKKMPRRR